MRVILLYANWSSRLQSKFIAWHPITSGAWNWATFVTSSQTSEIIDPLTLHLYCLLQPDCLKKKMNKSKSKENDHCLKVHEIKFWRRLFRGPFNHLSDKQWRRRDEGVEMWRTCRWGILMESGIYGGERWK